MKTLCCRCKHYMEYESHESIGDGAGIFFECAKCHNRIQLVTNAGETMLVHAMGIEIGKQDGTHEPLGLTRSTLLAEGKEDETAPIVTWSPGAKVRIERIPPSVRQFAMRSIENYVLEIGLTEVTEETLDEYKATQGHT